MNHLPILVIIIPLITALIIPLAGRIRKSFGWYLTVVSTLATFFCSFSLLNSVRASGRISYWLGGWEPPYGIEYVVDSLNAFVLVVVSFMAVIVALYASKSVNNEIGEEKAPLFYSVFMLFLTGLMGVTITGDVFNLFVFLEITSLSVYTLIAMGKGRGALLASFNYLILGTIAGTFILLGVGYLYMVTGTLNMADLRELLPPLYDTSAVRTAFAFFTVGLSLKIALFPLHIWLPAAYTRAPSVTSAMVAATATKVGAYVMLRFLFTIFTIDFDINVIPVSKILLVLSSIGIIMGSILALSQTNIKRMLAYSSVGQISYIVFGAALINEMAMTGAILHIFHHALMKGALFMVVGLVAYKTGIVDISGYKGLGKKMPYSMAAFTIAALSMLGAPLTVGFLTKWYLAYGAILAGMWYVVPVLLVSSMLSAIYFGRVIDYIYFHPAPDKGDGFQNANDEASFALVFPTFFLALLCIVFGVVTKLPYEVALEAARMLLGGS